MLRVVKNTLLGSIVIVAQEGQVWPAGRVAGQVFDAAVHGLHPSVLVRREPIRVVQVHLDEVLVVAICTSGPTSFRVHEGSIGDAHIGSKEARVRLTDLRVKRVDQVRLTLLGQGVVGIVAREVGKAGPFQDQRADGGQAVGRGVGDPGWVKIKGVVRDAGSCVEREAQVIAQVLGLLE